MYNEIPRIVVASGKGGAGKTSIACALASYAVHIKNDRLLLIDADVEEPNANLFLQQSVKNIEPSFIACPTFNSEKCSGCGECAKICNYNAIVMVKSKPLIFTDLCHACYGCEYVCKTEAIQMSRRSFAQMEYSSSGTLSLLTGRLNVKEVLSPHLISELKKSHYDGDYIIIDAPPGSACSTVAALHNAHVALFVVESSPFGLADFMRVRALAEEMNIPYLALVNKYSDEYSIIEKLQSNGVTVITHIPEDLELMRSYSDGEVVTYLLENYQSELEALYQKLIPYVCKVDGLT